MMDAGCYCVNMLRLVSGAEPRVVKASAELYPRSKVRTHAHTHTHTHTQNYNRSSRYTNALSTGVISPAIYQAAHAGSHDTHGMQ